MPTTCQITSVDQTTIHIEIYGNNNPTGLIINPAIGVKRKLYSAFANFMAAQGITTVLYNYRGMEGGLGELSNNVKSDAETWGRQDQSAVIEYVNTELKTNNVFVLGHSIGGQLLGFTEKIDVVDGLIHVASQKGDYRLWPFWGRIKLMLLWHVLIPLMSRGKVFNARKLGLGNYPWPAAAAKQWASWGQQPDYLFNKKFGFDLSAWHNFNKPLLSFGFTDDGMAPEAAIDGLLKEFGNNINDHRHIEKRIIDPTSMGLDGIGHFGFFKPEAQKLWQDTATWIQQNLNKH